MKGVPVRHKYTHNTAPEHGERQGLVHCVYIAIYALDLINKVSRCLGIIMNYSAAWDYRMGMLGLGF